MDFAKLSNKDKANVVKIENRESFFLFPEQKGVGTQSYDDLLCVDKKKIKQSIAKKKFNILDPKNNVANNKNLPGEKKPYLVQHPFNNGINALAYQDSDKKSNLERQKIKAEPIFRNKVSKRDICINLKPKDEVQKIGKYRNLTENSYDHDDYIALDDGIYQNKAQNVGKSKGSAFDIAMKDLLSSYGNAYQSENLDYKSKDAAKHANKKHPDRKPFTT